MRRGWILMGLCLLTAGGHLVAEVAPVTSAGVITNASPGTQVMLPVSVTGFSSIGRFTLTLTFDTTLARFISATTHPSLPGMTVTYIKTPSTSQGKLLFSWTGATNTSLPDGEVLSNLTMTYVTSTANLRWADSYGNVCEYKRMMNGTPVLLADTPQYQYYKDGGISNRGAPVTTAPSITVTSTGTVAVPITVSDFNNISSLTLNLEYNPGVMTYLGFTKNTAFGSTFQVGSVTGTGGMNKMVIQWYSTSPVTLSAGATLCTLSFNYTAATGNGTLLSWIDTGPACEFTDGSGAVLIDQPQSQYYINGQVVPPMVSVSVTPSMNPVPCGSAITVSASVVNGGTAPAYLWMINGTVAGSGPVLIYVPANLDTITCTVTSNLPLAGNNPCTSAPAIMTVIQSPPVVAGFTADTLTPAILDTVFFSDLSTGSPTQWAWTFDPPSAEFLNGTTAASMNPVVRFTQGGPYSVTLTVYLGCSRDTLIRPGYIRAGVRGRWTGAVSSVWTDAGNWDDRLVPDSVTDVVVPPSATHWPVFSGDLILGIHCRNLTVSGETGILTVTGDIILP